MLYITAQGGYVSNYISIGEMGFYELQTPSILLTGIQLSKGSSLKNYTKTTASQVIPISPTTSAPWNAFDTNGLSGWQPSSIFTPGEWVSIKLDGENVINSYEITSTEDVSINTGLPKDFTLEGSIDGSYWEEIDAQLGLTWNAVTTPQTKSFNINPPSARFIYFRIKVNATSNGLPVWINGFQVFKGVEVSSVKKIYPMSEYGVYDGQSNTFPQLVFNENDLTWWDNSLSEFIKFKVPGYSSVSKYSIKPSNGSNLKSWTMQGSIDDTNWTTLDSRSNITNWKDGVQNEFTLADSLGVWKYFRIYWTEVTGTYPEAKINVIKFYRKTDYKAYYESSVQSLHAFANGFTEKGIDNILVPGPLGQTFLNTHVGNTFVSSNLQSNGTTKIESKYRFPWLINDQTFFSIDSVLHEPNWPLFWSGGNYLFPVSDVTPIMTSNTTPSGYIVETSSEQPTNQGWMAFDNNSQTAWFTINNTTSADIILTLPSALTVRAYSIKIPSNVSYRNPTEWILYGGNFPDEWIELDVQTNQTGWAQGEERTYKILENLTAYKYYKWEIRESESSALEYLAIEQIRITEVPLKMAVNPIVDQYENKGAVSLVTFIDSTFTYDGRSVMDIQQGSVAYTRNLGMNKNTFTVEVKWSPKSTTLSGSKRLMGFLATLATNFSLVYNGTSFLLYLSSDNVTWNISNGLTVVYPVTALEWYHLRFTFDGTRYMFSVNDSILYNILDSRTVYSFPGLYLGGTGETNLGYYFDVRYMPFVEPPDRNYFMPYYSVLRYDPLTNLSQSSIDDNVALREGAWETNTEFLIGEISTEHGYPVPITYSYNALTILPIASYEGSSTAFIPITHNLGTTEVSEDLLIIPEAQIGTGNPPLVQKYESIEFNSVAIISGTLAWNGLRIGESYDRNTIGLRFPESASADYMAIYSGSGAISTVTGNQLTIKGIILRNF
jgi:hypothetical protein